jgi:hypothetical protein
MLGCRSCSRMDPTGFTEQMTDERHPALEIIEHAAR